MKRISRIKNNKYMAPALGGALCGLGIIFLLLTSTPDRVGPGGITIFFLLVWGFMASLGLVLRRFLLGRPGPGSLLLVILGSAVTTVTLALGTIEVGVGDIGLAVLLVIIFTIYWTKLREK